jgi:hypothetical protein
MRMIKTFLMHLYVDHELREQICGDLQALPERKSFSFKTRMELLQLIQQMMTQEAKEIPLRTSQDRSEPNLHGMEKPVE